MYNLHFNQYDAYFLKCFNSNMYEDVAFNIGKCKRMLATATQYSQPSTTENIMVIFVAYFSGEQNF